MDHYGVAPAIGCDAGSATAEDVRRYLGCVGAERALVDALEWVGAADAAARAMGFEVLGLTALDHRPALEALLECAVAGCVEADPVVRAAVAGALGQQSSQPGCVPLLLGLLADPDAEVREAAVGGLPMTVDDPSADHPAVVAVVDLLADDDATVRDWAAFVLGSQWAVDSPAIRRSLGGRCRSTWPTGVGIAVAAGRRRVG